MNEEMQVILANKPVLPVLTIHKLKHAIPLATALAEGGFDTIEITLRTESSLGAIKEIKTALPELIVGVGTVLDDADFDKAEQAGAAFAGSPAITDQLLNAAFDSRLPFLPGVATPSEVMAVRTLEYSCCKIYPAQAVGGVDLIRLLQGPFPDMFFCPSGGLTEANFAEYLGLSNVISVCGSWMAPQHLVDAEDWQAITVLSQQCLSSIR